MIKSCEFDPFLCVIFQLFFADFSVSFQCFLERVRWNFLYPRQNCMPSIESKKLLTIIEGKMVQRRRKELFIKLFGLSGLESNYDLYRYRSFKRFSWSRVTFKTCICTVPSICHFYKYGEHFSEFSMGWKCSGTGNSKKKIFANNDTCVFDCQQISK